MTVGIGIDDLANLYRDRVQVKACQRQGVDPEHECFEEVPNKATDWHLTRDGYTSLCDGHQYRIRTLHVTYASRVLSEEKWCAECLKAAPLWT